MGLRTFEVGPKWGKFKMAAKKKRCRVAALEAKTGLNLLKFMIVT